MDQVIDQLLAQTAEALKGRRLPEATYRLQFHAGFTFLDALAIVPYLDELGITDCYSSPGLKARAASPHGYDITDHRQLNPELGSAEDYAKWTGALQSRGLGQIFDIVPNHMAATEGNEWWNDVLENGPASPYAEFFDIAWSASPRAEFQGRILIPILGEPYAKALESQLLQLRYADGAFTIHYFEHSFPVVPHSYGLILEPSLEELRGLLGSDTPAVPELESILTALKHLPACSESAPERMAERQREKVIIKRRLAQLTVDHPQARESIGRACIRFNGQAGDPRSFDLLEGLLDNQVYRLAFWRVAADEINYRRFFDVNDLAALQMERQEVFQATHELIFRMLHEGGITGLRIDHIDGLYDPTQYLLRLQGQFMLDRARAAFDARAEYRSLEWKELEAALRERIAGQLREQRETQRWPLYTVVEKILGRNETLPEEWACYGSTGYDLLNLVNGLFVDAANAEMFTRLYQDWILDHTSFNEVVYRRKILILQIALSSELQMLSRQLDHLAQQNRWSRDFTRNSLLLALREIIACFPVYRTYISSQEIRESDREYVLRAVQLAMSRNPALSRALFLFVRDVLLGRSPDTPATNPEYEEEQRRFVGKFQQVTSAVMAKGFEDTSFYVFNRLLSLNEVGGDPDRFGWEPAELHLALQSRQSRWPWSFAASTTHDTKRSEDVRARLNVLSELPQDWRECVVRWSRLNQPHRIVVEDELAPDANEEYLLYQTLLGAWPLEPERPELWAQFVARIQAYMRKALHEAKVHTSWINPNDAYDEAVRQFIARILDADVSAAFLEDLRGFQQRISHYGMVNSLAQTLLKLTAPGVADIYQGTELWDFSLVDPDNRRPVDYQLRQGQLNELRARVEQAGPNRRELVRELVASRADGRIKLYVTWQALRARRESPGLFTSGQYLPLDAGGARRAHVFAFLRRQVSCYALVAVPRLLTRFVGVNEQPCGVNIWQDTALQLPRLPPPQRWINVFTGDTVAGASQSEDAMLPVAQLFAHFPVALLMARN